MSIIDCLNCLFLLRNFNCISRINNVTYLTDRIRITRIARPRSMIPTRIFLRCIRRLLLFRRFFRCVQILLIKSARRRTIMVLRSIRRPSRPNAKRRITMMMICNITRYMVVNVWQTKNFRRLGLIIRTPFTGSARDLNNITFCAVMKSIFNSSFLRPFLSNNRVFRLCKATSTRIARMAFKCQVLCRRFSFQGRLTSDFMGGRTRKASVDTRT